MTDQNKLRLYKLLVDQHEQLLDVISTWRDDSTVTKTWLKETKTALNRLSKKTRLARHWVC